MLAARRWLCLLGLLGACGDDDGVTSFDAAPPPDAPDAAPAPDADVPYVLRVDYLDPDHGPFRGGTEVLVRGRGFAEGMTVLIGGRMVEPLDLQIIDDRRALIVTPAGDPGDADVEVWANGTSATLPAGFRYESIYVEPASGAIAGGTWVVIQGFGTDFRDGDQVTFDGVPLVGTTVVNPQQITGFTPAGVAGSVDVTITGPGGVVTAEDAFTYTSTADPFFGGLGGGPIMGTVNIIVLDAMTRDGIDGAFVSVNDPTTSPFTGTTDPFGAITFSDPGFVGPITVTAAKDGYDRSSFVTFDAQDVTIFLVPKPDPNPGPLPPGRAAGTIFGHILFGDATGIGVPTWDLVPEPRTPTERKQARVFTTFRDPFSGNPDPGEGSIVEYVADGRIAWDFWITARPAALAVVAVAGLYDEALDPDGDGPLPPGRFQPFAMGAARGVLVGPGEAVTDVAVLIDRPLDTAIHVTLANPPPLGTPGFYGPTEYQAQAFIDLGGEGVIALPGNRATFPAGALTAPIPAQASLGGSIGDATYTIFAGAYSASGANPYSVRVLRGVGATELGAPVVVDGFLGVPRPFDPPMWGIATSMHLAWYPEGATTGEATFVLHRLQDSTDGASLWRLYTSGDVLDVPLYDLVSTGGIAPLPATPTYVYWTIFEVAIPGLSFDHFNFGHLNANYWSAYAADVLVVQFPPNP